MSTEYVISRLQSAQYKYPTAQILRTRIKNLDQEKRMQLLSGLKIELHRERNLNIFEPLSEVIYRG